jgi:uncharacterized membrane protein
VDSGRAKIPEGVRFAAAALLFSHQAAIRPCARRRREYHLAVEPEQSLEQRLASIEADLRTLVVRVTELELREPGAATPPPRAAPEAPLSTAAPPASPSLAKPAPAPAAPPPKARRPELELEDLLGGRILAWVGGLAIFVGVIFFLVIAVDRGWIGVEARVALAFLGSAVLLAVGLFLYERRDQTDAAVAAVATALAALYASLTYATSVQDVIGTEAGLLVAALIGAVGATIAVRWQSQFVAALGILGALAAPVLVGSDTSTLALAFMVVALSSAVAVLLWQRWEWLAIGAFLISAPQLAEWVLDRDDLSLPLPVLALYWGLFLVAGIGYELRVPTTALRASSASLLLVSAAVTAGLGWYVIDDRGSSNGATAWVLALTVAHIVLGGFGFRQRMSSEIAALLVAVGLGLSGVTLALALDGPALVVGWSAEAAILAWVAGRTGEQRALVFSGAFLALAALHTLGEEAPPGALIDGVPNLGEALVAVVCVGFAALIMGLLVERRDLWMVLFAFAAVAFVYAASLGIVDVIQGESVENSQTAQVALSLFWGVVGLAAIVIGLVRDIRELRLGGLVLLGIGVAKVFAYDLSELDSLYRVLSFIAVGLVLLTGAYAYQRMREAGRGV